MPSSTRNCVPCHEQEKLVTLAATAGPAVAKDCSRRLDGIEASVRMLPVMTPKQRRIADVLDQQAALIVDESIDDAQ